MKKLFWRATFILLVLWQTNLPAQICIPADQAPGPYICWPFITTISGNTGGYTPDVKPAGFCSTIENNAWFSFSPCSSKVTFTIISSNCESNLGLEGAIFDQNMNLVSNCYSSGGINLGGTITSDFVIPGQVYYFMIDGYQGDKCDYILTGTEGLSPSGTPVINSQTGYISGEVEICEGATATYIAVPPICNIASNGIACPLPDLSAYYDTVFHWTVPPGATIADPIDGQQIEVDWKDVQTGTVQVVMEIIPLNGSCEECAGGIPDFACSTEILPLNITIKPPYYNYLPPVNLCEGECFEVGDETYCESGHYETPFISVDGCDSIVIFDVFVSKNVVNRLPEKYLCDGDCLTEAGEVFCNEGEYEIHLNTAAGCDSLVVFEVILLDEPIERLPPISLCEGSCFRIDGKEFCESGNYQVDLQTVDGCDSIVLFSIEILKNSENILPLVEICDGDCYEFEGSQFCETGKYEFYRINRAGCDSLVVLEIIKNQTDITALPRINLCEGETFELGGTVFDEPGVNQVIFQNQFGCDSTVMFDLKYRTLTVDIPSSIILSPDRPSFQIMPDLGMSDRRNLKIKWEGFPGSYNALNQFVDTIGIYTLTVTDTLLGCSVTKIIEIHQFDRECQQGLFISPSPHCLSAPFLCGEFLDGFCAVTDTFSAFVLTGNIEDIIPDSLENPKWLRWSPCSETAVFRVGVKTSLFEKGLEFSVVKTDDCETYQPIIVGKKIKTTSVETITVNGLIPGEVYRFLLDGIDKDVCDFQIEIIDGVSKEPLEWEMVSPPKIIGDSNFCPGIPQILTLVPATCRLKNGNCAFANELMILKPTKIKWNLPSRAKPVDDLGSNQIEVIFQESDLMPRGANYLPDGQLLSDIISVEIETVIQLPDAVICTNNDTCKFAPQLEIQVNHDLEILPTIDVCESANFVFCNEIVGHSELKICREKCKTTVQQINVRQPQKINHGFIRICPSTCYTLPITGEEICEAGNFSFPIKEKCGGSESVSIGFYDKETITLGPVTEICHPLHISYQVSFDVLEGVPPYRIDGEAANGVRFISDSIPNGEPYVFEITDASICKSKEYLSGRYECGPFCISGAGTMEEVMLNVCADEVAKSIHNPNFTLDTDDGLEFILHTSPTDEPGQILDRNTEGDFVFLENSMSYDSVYYASAVVGTIVNGAIDLDDPCLSVAPGQPIVFRKVPSLNLESEIVLDCKNPTIELSAESLNGEPHTWTFPDGTRSDEVKITVAETGEYYFHALGTTGCSFSKIFTVVENKTLPIAEAGEEESLRCEQGFVQLNASASSVGAVFSYEWSTPDGEISTGQNEISARASEPGKYFLLVKNSANGCEKIDSVLVLQNDIPEHEATFSIVAPTCYGMSDGIIEIENIIGGQPPYSLSFDGAGFSDLESFRYLQSGEYELIIRDGFGCVLKENIKIDEPLPVEVDLGDDHFITLGDNVTLTAAASIVPDQIEWWNSLGEEFFGEPNWEVRAPISSTWFVRVIDERGCFAEDDVNIIVKESAVFIPSGFSPNNDQQNDFFTVFAGESVRQILSLRVYSRNGELVFENNNFPPSIEHTGWNGYFKGKKMHPNVFVYVADVEFINGDTKTYRGDITLIR